MSRNKHGFPRLPIKRRDKTIDYADLARVEIYNKTGGKCYYCGYAMAYGKFTVDHYIAQSLGGTNKPENLVPCCLDCNGNKANLTIDDWRNLFEREFGRREFYGEQSNKI